MGRVWRGEGGLGKMMGWGKWMIWWRGLLGTFWNVVLYKSLRDYGGGEWR